MSDEEVDELLKIADTSSGEVNYTGLSTPYPRLPPLLRLLTGGIELVRTILAN